MDGDIMIVFYEGRTLVTILGDFRHVMPGDVLDWYAKTYAFDRKKLEYSWSQTIQFDKEKCQELSNIKLAS